MCTFYFVYFSWFFSFLRDLNLDIFSVQYTSGCLVCVICNSNSFYSFLYKLCIMIVHTLKMCTSYYMHISWISFSFVGILNINIFHLTLKAPPIICSRRKGSLTLAMGKCLWFSVKIKVCQSSLSSPWSYPDLSTLWLWNPFSILNASMM